MEASSVDSPACNSPDWASCARRWPAPITVFFSLRSCSSVGGGSAMAAQGLRGRSGQRGVALEQGDIGADDAIAEPGLQPAQLRRSSPGSARCRRLVAGQFRTGEGEVAREWLTDDDAGSAELPVTGENRR